MSASPSAPSFPNAAAQSLRPDQAQDFAIELAQLEQSLKVNPSDINTLLRASKLMQSAGRSAEASTLLTQAAALAPERPEVAVAQAELLRANVMHDEALDLLQYAVEKSPNAPELWRAIAHTALELADFEKARTAFNEALRLNPNFHLCRFERAALHQRKGRLAEALADYKILRQVAPNDPAVLLGWASLRTAMGEREEAYRTYSTATNFVFDPQLVTGFLQRLAIMDFVYPLPRADLPPAPSTADAATRLNKIDIVFFHIDLPATTASPHENPDHQILTQAAAIARRQARGARIVLLTDEHTRIAADLQVDHVVRRSVDYTQLIPERLRMARDFLASGDAAESVVFLDSDVIVNRDPGEIFDGSFDIALVWKEDAPDPSLDAKVVLCRTSSAAILFYDHVIATHLALKKYPAVVARFSSEKMRPFWGPRFAIAATVGWTEFAQRKSDRLSVDGTTVRFLPADDYNFAVDPDMPKPRGLDRFFFFHFTSKPKLTTSPPVLAPLPPSPPVSATVTAQRRTAPQIRPTARELHVCFSNHSPQGRKTLIDLFDCLRAGLEETGFKITVSGNELRPDVPNIIFEYRNYIFKSLLDQNRGKVKLICFVTEIIKGDKFDDEGDRGWDGLKRFREFLSIADHYTGFLTPIPSNVDFLRTIAPATYFEFGYSERLLMPSDWRSWKHDYSCAGQMTPHRRKFLADVAPYITVKTPSDRGPHTALYTTTGDYLDLIQHTAVNIWLKQHPDWGYPSGARLARMLHSGNGCAREATEIELPLARFCPSFKDADDFLRRFTPMDRQKVAVEAQEYLSQYRAELPMKREIERNIAECPSLLTSI